MCILQQNTDTVVGLYGNIESHFLLLAEMKIIQPERIRCIRCAPEKITNDQRACNECSAEKEHENAGLVRVVSCWFIFKEKSILMIGNTFGVEKQSQTIIKN